ncbi:LysR substrate-binding domain-containing protein [Variovorax sp. J31P179]|uniref:LysR substrate-binding domain-containing protein n=1 Tax=Variovorax sp. J31P179 TaxID=3053508 RepID=UPI0033656160
MSVPSGSLFELQKETDWHSALELSGGDGTKLSAPLLPRYLTRYPKVNVLVEATDRSINLIEERFDLALRARPQIDDETGLVAKTLGSARRIMVASPAFLSSHGSRSRQRRRRAG